MLSSYPILLLQLFERTPLERLGYKDGTNPNIRNHKFFERIDWTKLEQRRVEPPFKPSVVSELSVIMKEEPISFGTIPRHVLNLIAKT